MRRVACVLLLLLSTLARANDAVEVVAPRGTAAASGREEVQRGVSLGLFSEDAGWSYAPQLDELVALGAHDVALVVPLYQEDVTATRVGYHPRFSPPLASVRRAIHDARARKLRVLVFPIVRLVTTHGPNEWRGTLRPVDRAAWMKSYGERLVELATIAQAEHAEALSIGSEMSTLDVARRPWEPLVAEVRKKFHGALTYSGNWDHFDRVDLYALVDTAGVCAYFPLADHDGAPLPSLEQLARAWDGPKQRLAGLAQVWNRPVLLTELGYRSQPNALHEPWDEGSAQPVDDVSLEAQRLGFAAFARAFATPPTWLRGFYVWNWYGWGGRGSRSYNPRGKPAQEAVEELLRR